MKRVYKVEWLEFSSERSFKCVKKEFTVLSKAVECYLEQDQHTLISSPEDLGFKSNKDMERYLQRSFEKQMISFDRAMLDRIYPYSI